MLRLKVGAEVGASGGISHCLGSLWEASVKHGKDFRFEECLLEVEEAGGGRSPLTPQKVQGSLCTLAVDVVSVGAQVLGHQELPV